MSHQDRFTSKIAVEKPLSQKLADLDGFMKKHRFVMLTTQSPSGEIHSRCMDPAEITSDWKIRIIYDRDSFMDKEIENE